MCTTLSMYISTHAVSVHVTAVKDMTLPVNTIEMMINTAIHMYMYN